MGYISRAGRATIVDFATRKGNAATYKGFCATLIYDQIVFQGFKGGYSPKDVGVICMTGDNLLALCQIIETVVAVAAQLVWLTMEAHQSGEAGHLGSILVKIIKGLKGFIV